MDSKITATSTATATATTNAIATTQDNNSFHIVIHIICICFLTVTAMGRLVQAHAEGDLSSVIFEVIFMYPVSVSIICCSLALSRMPIEDKSAKKGFLIIMLMVLSAALVFGVIIHIPDGVIGIIATVIILGSMTAIYGFILFFICRDYSKYKECNKSLADPEKVGDNKLTIKASDEPMSPLENV